MIGTVRLGRTAQRISAIGLGTGTFGREIDEQTAWRIMDYAVAHGITFFDTAEAYGGGLQSPHGVVDEKLLAERIIGNWMRSRGCRDSISLCTKISWGRGSAEEIQQAVAGSLERLQTDRLDIYKLHKPATEAPVSETLSALADQMKAGTITAIGCSNFSAAQLGEALTTSRELGLPRFEITQPPLNLVNHSGDVDLLPLCEVEGISITPHSPLGNGFLTGKYSPDRSKLPPGTRLAIAPSHIDLYFHERGWRVLERLRAKSTELGVPMVRLAMGWVMKQPAVDAVLVGAR